MIWDINGFLAKSTQVINDLYSVEQSASAKCRQVLATFVTRKLGQQMAGTNSLLHLDRVRSQSCSILLHARVLVMEIGQTRASKITIPRHPLLNKSFAAVSRTISS